MNDGIRVAIRIRPLRAPSTAGINRASSNPSRGVPLAACCPNRYPPIAINEPTERSNSPEIISRVTPMVTTPVRVAALRMPETVRSDRKLDATTENRTKIAIQVASGPITDELSNRRLRLSRQPATTLVTTVTRTLLAIPDSNGQGQCRRSPARSSDRRAYGGLAVLSGQCLDDRHIAQVHETGAGGRDWQRRRDVLTQQQRQV